MDDGRRIVAFYEGSAPDDRGRLLEDILRFDDDALERTHDFIQWLFPMRERSAANPGAPRLDGAAVEAFQTRPHLRTALRRSLDRMLTFYGLEWAGEAIVRSWSFASHGGWLTPGNHNHLRFTRMLTSLRILGADEAARQLFRCLRDIHAEERRSGRARISERTFSYWSEAAQEPTASA
ncbi:MAG: hypothetical protein NVS3B16_02620 [Vulcanimicrobiaceae bacterium]